MNSASPHSTPSSLEAARTSLSRSPATVALWQPQIVLASWVGLSPRTHLLSPTPSASPEAMHDQLESARALSDELASARQAFGAQAAEARDRAAHATSERERLTATMAAYRAEARLDEVLTCTLREVRALMKRRGLQ